jgi:hypothetical protein
MTDEPTDAELRAAKAGAAGADDDLAGRRDRKRRSRWAVTWDKTRTPNKPRMPDLPEHDDSDGQYAWVTSVLHLDRDRPVIKATHQGLSGGAGHVVLERFNAPDIRFEPATKIGSAQKLADELVWQLQPTDGEPYPWSNQQATKIARVVRLLCDATKLSTVDLETELVVTTLLEGSTRKRGHTHGTSTERAEVAVALRPVDGVTAYVVDTDTGELVVRVSDLQQIARHITGGSVAYGWLDARMEALNWTRVRLDGHTASESPDKQGAHARVDAYRGRLSGADDA